MEIRTCVHAITCMPPTQGVASLQGVASMVQFWHVYLWRMRCCQATEVLLVLQLRENDFPSGMWQRGRFEVCKGRKALSTQHHIWT